MFILQPVVINYRTLTMLSTCANHVSIELWALSFIFIFYLDHFIYFITLKLCPSWRISLFLKIDFLVEYWQNYKEQSAISWYFLKAEWLCIASVFTCWKSNIKVVFYFQRIKISIWSCDFSIPLALSLLTYRAWYILMWWY